MSNVIRVNPNLLSSHPKIWISDITLGITGTNCDSSSATIKHLTNETIIQVGVRLLESSIFCIRKSLTFASL
nr:hypothetical protein [Epilithonimonas vandammei]